MEKITSIKAFVSTVLLGFIVVGTVFSLLDAMVFIFLSISVTALSLVYISDSEVDYGIISGNILVIFNILLVCYPNSSLVIYCMITTALVTLYFLIKDVI